MGLLLSVLITCVGVLEVIACYTHFRIGVAYNECKSNIRDIAKYYALELRKHELHFEPGPDAGGGEETLSELVRRRIRSTIRIQEKSQQYSNGHVTNALTTSNGHAIGASCSHTPDQGTTPTYTDLTVPRNSISGLDSPTVQTLLTPDVDITEAVAEKIQRLENSESWNRKSPSPYSEKTGLEVVEKNFWRSRSPSPFPENDNNSSLEIKYNTESDTSKSMPSLTEAEVLRHIQKSSSGSEIVDKDYWNKTISSSENDLTYSKTDLEIQNILPSDLPHSYSKTDLEVQTLTEGLEQTCNNQDILFGMPEDIETKFDEAFLRSLDGVKRCDDRRRSFKKKRNSSSTSSRASREDLRSIASLDDVEIETSKKHEGSIPPLAEETETLFSEKCESLKSPPPYETPKQTKEERQTHFTATENNTTSDINKPTNLSFTEKVKDLEISVQLMVTVKGTSQGDQMQYTTNISPGDQSKTIQQQQQQQQQQTQEDSITKSTEEQSDFGKVKTSVTYGQSNLPNNQIAPKIDDIKPVSNVEKSKELKHLQISSQSLIHSERTMQDDVKSSEEEFLKLYESFTELPPREKDKFLKIIGQTNRDKIEENPTVENLEILPPENKDSLTKVENITSIKPAEELYVDSSSKQNFKTIPQETKESLMTLENSVANTNLNNTNLEIENQISKQIHPEEITESVKKVENLEIQKQVPIVDTTSKQNLEINSLENKESLDTRQEPISTDNSGKDGSKNKEIVLIKEITEITESTETVMKIPPAEKPIENILPSNQNISDNVVQKTNYENNETLSEVPINYNTMLLSDNKNCDNVSNVTNKNRTADETTSIEHSQKITNETSTISNNDTLSNQSTNESKNELIDRTLIETQNTPTSSEEITKQIVQSENTSLMKDDEIQKEQSKTEEDKTNKSSSSSSETPSTVIENVLRRASKTSFEDASVYQNQEMMERRLSSSEISPKQASQAFWLIFSAEFTNAMEKDWHGQHFSCWQCDESLTGQRYVLREEHPYCVKCYEQVFANTCEKCNRTIGIDSKDLSYKEKHWHEACFQCTSCAQSLVDKQFGAKGEKIYCGNCYDKQFASKCDGCGNIFHAGTKKMEYKNRQWHEQCFKCCTCETPIGTKSFIPREKDIYCAGCYEEKFATRCVKCNKAIQTGGVTYKNEPWHRDCFTCTHCNKNLAGQRFTSRDDKPCCAECFGRLFAKRCTSCNEPITGIGGTRFISFEDRHWHNDCFICASCSTSLVGRGFITDESRIICPECAKERFM